MASSAVEICNLMLSWISAKQITSFDDDTVESDFCKFNYDISRRAVLEVRTWTFATRKVRLTPLADSPLFGFSFKFLVPPVSLRVSRVFDPSNTNHIDPPEIRHRIEIDQDNKKVILANLAEIDVSYIFDQSETQLFSPLFDQALAAYMAYSAAVPITQDKDLQARMFGVYNEKLDDATFADSLQGTQELLDRSQLEDSRRLYVRPY